MVFESIIADVLNKFLGDYVENLDRSQLKVGIWGGDVVLKDLELKPSALDELDLPVKTVYGHLGQLVLKIPWTNLYAAPVCVTVERLFVLAVPNTEIRYNAEKEERYLQEAKQAELQRVENAKKLEREREHPDDKPKQADSFAEKLATQIIKNIQARISEIHIRYEDNYSHPDKPFALGVTLHNISVHSTDSDWKAGIQEAASAMIYKVLQLESLALYWNCQTSLFRRGGGEEDIKRKLRDTICSSANAVPENKYILGPINLAAQLRINPKPESDGSSFSIPKLLLGVTLESLTLALSKSQYQDMIMLLESLDGMARATAFRKYRPSVVCRGHPREWWRYAYTCVVEGEVLRRRRNWNWKHMRQHREMCRVYAKSYRAKLQSKRLPPSVQEDLVRCEHDLDVFNIVIIRQTVEVELERSQSKQRQGSEGTQKRGWWPGWFSRTEEPKETDAAFAASLVRKFEDAMTSEEKKKLYKAIDYQEHASPALYPVNYVENSFNFELKGLVLEVRDDSYDVPRIMCIELQSVMLRFEQRPAADAMKIVSTVGSLGVSGLQQGSETPQLVHFHSLGSKVKLFDVLFETNPLDGTCDQRLHMSSRPLKIVYDAQTINKLVDVFSTPKSLAIAQLQAAAESRLTDFKEMSATGLQYAIEQHSVLDINIDLSASYLILPQGGFFRPDESLLVANLGHLSMVSMNQDRSQVASVKELHQQGLAEAEILRRMAAQSYDRYLLRLKDIQILMVLPGEDWEAALHAKKRCPPHILEPTSLELLLLQCLVAEDPRLPRFKVEGLLPSVMIHFEDERMLHLMSLVACLPTPGAEPEPAAGAQRSMSRASSMTSGISRAFMDLPMESRRSRDSRGSGRRKRPPAADHRAEDFVQSIDMQVDFILKDLHLALYKREAEGQLSVHLMDFKVTRLIVQVLQRTFDTTANVNVGSVDLLYTDVDRQVGMVSTPMAEGDDKYMLLFQMTMADKRSPEFLSRHSGVVQLLELDITGVTILLHQEALLMLWEYTTVLQERFSQTMQQYGAHAKAAPAAVAAVAAATVAATAMSSGVSRTGTTLGTISEEPGARQPPRTPLRRRRRSDFEPVDMKLLAKLFMFRVELLNRRHSLAQFSLEGGSLDVVVKRSYTGVILKLRDIGLYDPNPQTVHHEIMTVMGEEALSVQVVMFNLEELEPTPDTVDMTLIVHTSPIRLFVLQWFINTLLNFVQSLKTMQEILGQAAKDAAEAALQNVQDAYVKATRMALSIDLQAPVIVVPASSKSREALYMDLGTLTIKNMFDTLEVVSERGENAVIDEITIDLQDMKLSRVLLDEKSMVVREAKLLKPISFILVVKRNISCSWYTHVPYIDMSGRLHTVLINLSEDDYHLILRISAENLAEGQDDSMQRGMSHVGGEPTRGSVDRPRALGPSKVMAVDAEPQQQQQQQTLAPSYKDLTPTTGAVTTMVKFTFTLDSMIIDLISGRTMHEKPNALSAGDSQPPPPQAQCKGLARISLNIFSLKGHMYSDGTLSTCLLLVDCLLDDTRPNRQSKITRLMQRKMETQEGGEVHIGDGPVPHSLDDPTSDQPFRSMLDVTFQQKGQDMFLDVRVFGFDLVLSTEYMMRIADFFMGWTYQSLDEEEPEPSAASAAPARSGTRRAPAKSVTTPAPPAPGTAGMTTLNLRVERPDIIMVETMDDLDTSALVLNMELTQKIRVSTDHLVMCGNIKDLQLYSCCYNPRRRSETTYQILRPCCISLAGSTPAGEGLHMDICLTPVRMSVSPATIQLVGNVAAGLTLPEVTKVEAEVEEVDFSDLWDTHDLDDEDFWFLRTGLAEDAMSLDEPEDTRPSSMQLDELCIISASSIVLTMEAGVGHQTLPMILAEASFSGSISNWSSSMYVDSCMSVEMRYYNSKLAIWEPLLETVEALQQGQLVHVPWELRMEVQMNPVQEELHSPMSGAGEDAEELHLPPPAMSVEISSKENLEITMTKTCLEVLTNLANSFQSALTGMLPRAEETAPYTVRNDTGLAVAVLLGDSPFEVINSPDAGHYQEVMLESGAKVELGLKVLDKEDIWREAHQKKGASENFLSVKVVERNCTLSLPVKRADKRYFSLKHRGEGNDPWGLVSDVEVKDGGTVVTLRSILQVQNHFHVPVNVYFMTKRGNEVECIGTVAHGEKLNLPLYAVYTPTNELFFSVEGYTVSVVPFVWKDLQNQLTVTKMLQCEPKDDNNSEPFFMRIVGEVEQVFFEKTARHTMLSTCYNLHLRPAVVLKNLLPVAVLVCLEDTMLEQGLGPGDRMQVPTAEPGKCSFIVQIPEYLEKEWVCTHPLEIRSPEFSVWTFYSTDSIQRVALDLGMRTVVRQGTTVLTLYCPYWLINKTGRMLTYRKSRKTPQDSAGSPLKHADEVTNILYHPEHFRGPVLFSFKAKSFFGKKKAAVKVEDSEWSKMFSLDVAGSSGVVTCKHPEITYKVGVYVSLIHASLTKQITFTPYYVLLNNAGFPIEVQEADRPADPWILVEPNGCAPLWPRSDNCHLRARVAATEELTPPFGFDKVYTTLLLLANKYGGLNVDVQVAEGSVYISFMSYEPGLAPALLINHLHVPVSYQEKDTDDVKTLAPKNWTMFTWGNPLGSCQLIIHNHKKKDISDNLCKDGIGEFNPEPGKKAYWVNFLDGMQRVMLFTTELTIARDAQLAGELERTDQEITLTVHGFGLSLVNNINSFELIYCCMASSGVIWESRKPNQKRFKPMTVRETRLLEDAYVRHRQALLLGESPGVVTLGDRFEVDFEAEELVRPSRRILRRTYHTGLWLQLKTSRHQMHIHARINKLQVDNQMKDCLFPVVVAPVSPPRSVAADAASKPFFELSIVRRLMEHSPVVQYKYFKVLVQEFHVRIDMGFISAMLVFFEAEEASDEDERLHFLEDVAVVNQPLMSHALRESSAEQKNFYDLLHFSPLKIHVSFSLSSGSGQMVKTGQDVTVMLQSLGVTLTDVQDVVFKLGYFERQYTFLTQRQLLSEVQMHYMGQALKQLYVLVLGLDVLGNPYGLVLGVAQGVEDLFYEPYKGAIQGPGEFAEGLVLGVRSLFGRTLGGTAGAISQITGAMGKGVAVLTFDKEYQRKRREARAQRPANIHTGLAQSGKGLVMGVVDGVSGVFTKPITGARQEGVEGFFKGVGKGMVGLVTRPTVGIIDFASGTLAQVKRVTDPTEEMTRLRPPRFFHPDGQVRPYVLHEAEGHLLLQELEKGRYYSTDVYVYHMNMVPGPKDVLLLTDKRVMYLVHNDVFGGWQVDWDYTWDMLSEPPSAVEKGVLVMTGEPRRRLLSMFGSSDRGGKILLVKDEGQKEWLVNKMKEIMKS